MTLEYATKSRVSPNSVHTTKPNPTLIRSKVRFIWPGEEECLSQFFDLGCDQRLMKNEQIVLGNINTQIEYPVALGTLSGFLRTENMFKYKSIRLPKPLLFVCHLKVFALTCNYKL